MAAEAIQVRPAEDSDRRPLALLFTAVAEERDGIAAEPPIDVEQWAASWPLDGTLVALVAGEVVGELRLEPTSFGYGEIGMMVAADWRGRGVGTALVAAAIDRARTRGLHKLTLSVFPHNDAAIAFVPEVRLRRRGTAQQTNPARQWRALGLDRDGVAPLTARAPSIGQSIPALQLVETHHERRVREYADGDPAAE